MNNAPCGSDDAELAAVECDNRGPWGEHDQRGTLNSTTSPPASLPGLRMRSAQPVRAVPLAGGPYPRATAVPPTTVQQVLLNTGYPPPALVDIVTLNTTTPI